MLRDHLNHTFTSKRKTTTNTDWIERVVESQIYVDVPCHIYKPSGRFGETNLSVNTQLDSWTVLTEWQYVNLKIWDFLVITDPDLWVIGDYEIQTPPKVNRLSNGKVDSIQFSVYAI